MLRPVASARDSDSRGPCRRCGQQVTTAHTRGRNEDGSYYHVECPAPAAAAAARSGAPKKAIEEAVGAAYAYPDERRAAAVRQQLAEMGFAGADADDGLLRACAYDVARVIDRLVGGGATNAPAATSLPVLGICYLCNAPMYHHQPLGIDQDRKYLHMECWNRA